MSIVCIGLSYKTAPIEIQEAMASAARDIPLVLEELCNEPGVRGAFVLSTCNRFEVYVDAKDDSLGLNAARRFFGNRLGEDDSVLRELRSRGAINHLVRVACSLESRILGEAQILGQVKRALEQSRQADCLTEDLTQLVKCAISAGKRVQSQTAIGEESISLSTVALKAASRHLGGLEGKSVLIVGSGEMARLAAVYLKDIPLARLAVTSRNISHASSFAEEFKMAVVPFDSFLQEAATSDIIFVAVRCDDIILDAAALEHARWEAGRSKSPLLIIDEGLPRNVDSRCREVFGVELIDLDSLNRDLDAALDHRRSAMKDAWSIVDEAVDDYCSWLQEHYVAPTIKAIYQKADSVVAKETEHACRALAKELGRPVNEQEEAILEAFGNAMMKKLLHGPTARLRKEAHSPDSSNYTVAARYLFGLDTFPVGSVTPDHGQCRTCTTHACRNNDFRSRDMKDPNLSCPLFTAVVA